MCVRQNPLYAHPLKQFLWRDERVVYFDFDKSDLTPAAEAKLRSVARRLLQSEDVASAQVVGFADRIGDTEYNTSLSARRAQTVRDFLVKNGYLNVNVTNLRAMGESSPVTNCSRDVDRNSQITCLRPDRRVEIELMYIGQVVTTTVEPDAELSR
jgi:OOP family OmpA-OmpF porin